jgi:pyruvate, orthophosphate dikinase
MQAQAIFEAACDVAKEGVEVRPEVMIPLIGTTRELEITKEQVERVAKEVFEQKRCKVPVIIGTMIEIPRAALTAGDIAKKAEFFSFGTNDLTQMTFGYSRDDVGAFLPTYLQERVVPKDPFESIDTEGVGQLVKMAAENGRRANPKLKVGICGEHGGDPDSIRFFRTVGLDYVSCSPFRVPVARLAAAQAELEQKERDA